MTIGTAYTGQLAVSGSSGTMSYVTNATSSNVSISGTGVITSPNTTPLGTYVVSGTESDSSGDSGAWSFTLSVIPSLTTTGISSSVNPTTSPQSTTFTATVTGATPTGSVSFMDGTTLLGTRATTAGVATFATGALTVGSHSVTAVYSGDADNSASMSSVLTQLVKSSTTTALTSSVNPSSLDQSVTFTATVGGATPTGTVSFMDGATTLATNTTTSGVASYSTGALAIGSHSITAVYSGDVDNVTSTSSALTQVVNPATTGTVLSSSQDPSIVAESTTFAATVTGISPTGSVSFMDGSTVLAVRTTTSGVASYSTGGLAVGSHAITAVYSGDADNATSTSTVLTQVVSKAATATSLTSSVNPSITPQSVTFTATVTGATPTGSVTFMDGTTVLAVRTTSAGIASYSTGSLAVGSHAITAVYGGDADNLTSNSPGLSQMVKSPTTTTLASSVDPSSLDQSTTFTATVTGVTPTGSVTFMDGATVLATNPITTGVATYSTGSLIVGSHAITAVYNGDPDNVASTSTVLTQTVTKASTTTVLTSSANPSSFSHPTTFTATVTGVTPTGSVTFVDGSTAVATGPVTAGVATYSNPGLAVGSHAITAVYNGDADNTTSASVVLTQMVVKSPSSTALTSSLNPSSFSHPTTFMATVTGAGPTGSVTFTDGATCWQRTQSALASPPTRREPSPSGAMPSPLSTVGTATMPRPPRRSSPRWWPSRRRLRRSPHR